MDSAPQEHARQIINLGQTISIASVIMRELRDETLQTDRIRFRNNVSRLGQIAAYEISKTMNFKDVEIDTPLSQATGKEFVSQPVIAPILRAGLPLYEGMLSFFPQADSAFISAYRKHDQYDGFEIEMTSISCPNINDRTLIICDPMIATGQSLLTSIKEIFKLGNPFEVIVASVIASEEGLEFVAEQFPKIPIYTFAIDPQLNAKSYIVPGLGDAGDLSFGPKIQE